MSCCYKQKNQVHSYKLTPPTPKIQPKIQPKLYFPSKIKILVFGQTATGKTTLIRNLGCEIQKGPTSQSIQYQVSQKIDNLQINFNFTDTMGLGTDTHTWLRVRKFNISSAIVLLIISSSSIQSFNYAKKIIELCQDNNKLNKNRTNYICLINFKENNKYQLNKSQVYEYFFSKNIQFYQINFLSFQNNNNKIINQNQSSKIKSIKQDLLLIFIQRYIFSFSKLNQFDLSYKYNGVCIVGTKNSKKNLFFQQLTGITQLNNIQWFLKSKVKIQSWNQSIQLILSQDLDSSDIVKFTNNWQRISKICKNFILVVDLSLNKSTIPLQFQKNKQIINNMIDLYKNYQLKSFCVVGYNSINQDSSIFIKKGFKFILINNFDTQSSNTCFKWCFEDFYFKNQRKKMVKETQKRIFQEIESKYHKYMQKRNKPQSFCGIY